MHAASVAVVIALAAGVLVSNFVVGRMGREGFPKDGPSDCKGWGAKTASRLSKRW